MKKKQDKIEWPADFKKTKQRVLVLEAMEEAKKPLTAQELFSILASRGAPLWYSTIYRTLDMFVEHGMAQKVAALENGMAVYGLCGSHRHYAVCVGCHSAVELQGCPLEGLLPALDKQSFHVLNHRMQVSGYCRECYKKLSRE